jgi:hypothetical protein
MPEHYYGVVLFLKFQGGNAVQPRSQAISSVLIVFVLLRQGIAQQPPSTGPVTEDVIIENLLKDVRDTDRPGTALINPPAVRVTHRNRKPVAAGVLVKFSVPNSGPGATFPNGATEMEFPTDDQGVARANGLKANNSSGPYQVNVTVSFTDAAGNLLVGSTTIQRSNGTPIPMFSAKILMLMAATAAGISIGAVACCGGSQQPQATIGFGPARAGTAPVAPAVFRAPRR